MLPLKTFIVASTYNGHGSGKESDDNTQRSQSSSDRYEKSKSTSRSKENKDLNGSYSGSKRKYHSSEVSILSITKHYLQM